MVKRLAILGDAYSAGNRDGNGVIRIIRFLLEAAGRRVLVLEDIRELGKHSKNCMPASQKVISQAKSHLCTCTAKKWKHSMMREKVSSSLALPAMDKAIADLKSCDSREWQVLSNQQLGF